MLTKVNIPIGGDLSVAERVCGKMQAVWQNGLNALQTACSAFKGLLAGLSPLFVQVGGRLLMKR